MKTVIENLYVAQWGHYRIKSNLANSFNKQIDFSRKVGHHPKQLKSRTFSQKFWKLGSL